MRCVCDTLCENFTIVFLFDVYFPVPRREAARGPGQGIPENMLTS